MINPEEGGAGNYIKETYEVGLQICFLNTQLLIGTLESITNHISDCKFESKVNLRYGWYKRDDHTSVCKTRVLWYYCIKVSFVRLKGGRARSGRHRTCSQFHIISEHSVLVPLCSYHKGQNIPYCSTLEGYYSCFTHSLETPRTPIPRGWIPAPQLSHRGWFPSTPPPVSCTPLLP